MGKLPAKRSASNRTSPVTGEDSQPLIPSLKGLLVKRSAPNSDASDSRKSEANTVVYADTETSYAGVQPGQTPDDKAGHVHHEADDIEQDFDRLLNKRGVPDSARESLKRKWRADILAAKGEVTERVAPLGWRELSTDEITAAIEYGKANPWENPDGTRNGKYLFEWIFDQYQAWIPGLTQSVLRSADGSLYRDLHLALSNARVGLAVIPTWFKVAGDDGERLLVPADKDAALFGLTPEDKEALLASREKSRVARAAQRASAQGPKKTKGQLRQKSRKNDP